MSSSFSSPTSLPQDYEEILLELHTTIHETWNGPSALEPPAEYGPTGKWTYKFELSTNGTSRIYQRCLSSGLVPSETVLELPPTAEAIAMSLTPDETCIACLLQPEDNSSSPWITLRSMESRKVKNLTGIEWLGNIANAPSEVVGLEWGPILSREKMANNRSQNYDSISFVYSLYLLLADDQGRPNRVALCHIHSSTLELIAPPTLIYSSDDPAVMVDVQRTKGCSFVCIRALSKISSEVFLSQGDSGVVLVRPRQDGVLYHMDVGKEGDVVLLTSDERYPNGGDYFLEETTIGALPLPITTQPSLALDDQEFFVEDMDLFRTHIVLYERSRRNGEQRVRLQQRDLGDRKSKPRDTILDLSSFSSENCDTGNLVLPLYWSKLTPVGNICFESSFFRFELESPVAPGLVYQYDFDSEELAMVSGGGDGADDVTAKQQLQTRSSQSFRKEKILVESSDGTKVPLTLFIKKENNDETQNTSQNPNKTIVLVGYGAYGEPMDLGYNPGWKPLLDRGVMIAFAHTRGGGDLGRAWYAKGRGEHKLKGIEDYEACAFYLRERFDNNNTNKSLLKEEQESFSLVAKAFSAGGVLVGAVVNRNPGLFDKVILTNAFVDVASTMDRPSLFLTEHEYDEFGNPESDPIAKARIRSYCPMYNLNPMVQSQQTSTRFLLIGTLDDPNVPYWNALLYFRKLLEGFRGEPIVARNNTADSEAGVQEFQNDRVFLELQTRGGHYFSGPNRIDVLALENAFILKV